MTYIHYELHKLFGIRYIWIFLAVLLIVNAGLCIYTTSQKLEYSVPADITADFFELYFSDTEALEAEYAQRQLLQEEQARLWREAAAQGIYDYNQEPIPNKYIESDKWSDSSLFNEIFGRRDAILNYPGTIQKVINRADANLAEFDSMQIPANSYTYKYQLRVIDLYKTAQSEVRMGLEYTRGWGDYFAYDIVNIFIFAMLIITGSVVFAYEKNSGFLPIIRVSKYGRTKTALAKIAAMMITSVVIVLLFTLSAFLIFGIRLGYSSAANAIQVFDIFTLSPFVITVGQYFAVTIAVKLLTYTFFSTILLLVSVFFYNYALNYICGLGFFGLNFLLYTLSYINADNPLKNLNFVATAAVSPLFVRYRSMNLFGAVCSYVPFMVTAFSLLLIVSLSATVYIYNRGSAGIDVMRITRIAAWFRNTGTYLLRLFVKDNRQARKVRSYNRSLIFAEIYKTLISGRYIIVIIILLTVKIYISTDNFKAKNSYSDAVYKEYMTALEGPVNDEKRAYITAERTYINETLAKQKPMQLAYISEEITLEEYHQYLTDYNYAYSRSEYLTVIESHQVYIDETFATKGVEAWFVYDTGWKLLFHNSFDVILYAALLILFSGSFADEYASRSSSGSFVQILRTTKKGRIHTFRSKLISAVSISAVLTLLFNAVDFIIIRNNYGFPAADAPLLSLKTFADIDGGITVTKYLMMFFILRVAAAVLLSLAICGVSELLRRNIPVMSVIVAFTLFPALLAYFGLELFGFADFTSLLAVTPLVLLSAFGATDYGLLAVFTCISAISAFLILLRSKHTYVK
ncbi:MAG: hypothetical protein ACYCWE_01435 [Eubacteriales bacterium]